MSHLEDALSGPQCPHGHARLRRPGGFGACCLLVSYPISSGAVLTLRSDSQASLCDPTTVFVTISSLSTLTLYRSSPETVYVTLPCSSEGTSTSTLTIHSTMTATNYPQVDTIYLTAPGHTSASLPENAATTEAPKYATTATITHTTVVVITNPTGTPTFVVENGTTYWLNGQTPAPSASYVVETSAVTVEPVPESSTCDETSTIISTHLSTQQFTISETRPTSSALKVNSSPITYSTPQSTLTQTRASTPPASHVSSVVGTGSSFTGIGAGGWNATSTARSGAHTGATAAIDSPISLSLIPIDPSQPISLATTFLPLSLSSLAAQSGFNEFSTSSAMGSTSTSAGTHTSTPVPPYANSTSSTFSSATIRSSSSTTSALGTAVSSPSVYLPTGYSTTGSQVSNSTTSKSSYSTSIPLSTPPPSTISNKTSTAVSSTASATPTVCGEQGDFTLTVSTSRATISAES